MAHEVFLCHSARDKQIADAACAALEARRISCWIAPRDVLAGEEWGKSIIEALTSSNIVVLIFSGHANESPQVRREIERAVSKAKIIVPFRIENVLPSDAMEYALGNTHWLDAMSPPMEQCLTNLCQTISRLLQRQHPSQPLWRPGDPVASAESQTAKTQLVDEPPRMTRTVERNVEVPEASDWHSSCAGSEAPSQRAVSGERISSQPVDAAAAPVSPAATPAPPKPIPPAPPAWAPPASVQPRPSAGTPAGSKAGFWAAVAAAVAILAILAFAAPRLRKTDASATATVTSPSMTATTGAAPPNPEVSPQPPAVLAATPVAEATVDQPAPTADRPAPALPKPSATVAVRAPDSPPATATPAPAEAKKANLDKLPIRNNFSSAKEVCAAGTPHGCMLAGQMLEHGEGTTRDDRQARTFYQKACDLGEPRGCTNLAFLYETSQNPTEAVVFYRKGCDGGNPIACTQLGVMYDLGQGIIQDYAQAATVYRKGCDAGNLRGCSNLGSLYLGGKGVARDENEAMMLYRKACGGGYEAACRHMKTTSP